MTDEEKDIPEVARPVTIDDLSPEQLDTFMELAVAYEALIAAGVDKYRLIASMPTI